MYLLVQLASRDYVASVMLDELLEGRDAMTQFLEQRVILKAAHSGSVSSVSASRTWSCRAR